MTEAPTMSTTAPDRDAERALAPPPHNVEAEDGLLGSILADPEVMAEVATILGPEDFYRAANAAVATVLWARFAAGQPLDPLLVDEDLRRRGGFDGTEATLYLGGLLERVASPANATYYAQIVRQKAIARGLIEAGNKILRDGYSDRYPSEDLVARADAEVFALAERLAGSATLRDAAEVGDAALERIDLRREGITGGVTTGFRDLDDIVVGLRDANLAVLAARPAQGKTALALNIAAHVAFTLEVPTLFFSLEMEHGDLGERLLSSRSGVAGRKLEDPRRLDDRDLRALGAARGGLAGGLLAIDDCPVRTVAQLGAVARLRQKRSGLGFVLIDYLSLIDGQPRRGESRQEEVARMARELKALARTLNLPILLLCQLNREVERRGDGLPRLADLRESGQIEQEASVVLLLHRAAATPTLAEVVVAKNRFGRTGVARLAFHRECTRFDSLAHPDSDEPGHRADDAG